MRWSARPRQWFSRKDTTHGGLDQSALLEVLDALKVAEARVDAGLAAEGARAFAEAVGYYRRALELWEQVSDSSAYLRLTVVARSRDEACAGRVRPVALCRLGP